jgi:hypothetical protein
MLLLVLHIAIVFWILSRSNFLKLEGVSNLWMALLLILKVVGGYCVGRFYLATYQGGDIQGYLSDANQFFVLFGESPADFFRLIFGLEVEYDSLKDFYSSLTTWFDSGYSNHYNDARSVVRFHALVRLFSDGNEWIHLLWSNVLCIAGMVALIQFVNAQNFQSFAFNRWALLFLFLPNVFIWSSSILKEPLLIFAMGMSLKYFQRWNFNRNISNAVAMLFFVFCFFLVKSFWLLVLLPGLLIWFVMPIMKRASLTVTLSYCAILLLVLLVGEFLLPLNLPDLIFGQQRNMWRYVVYMHSGSIIHPVSFAPNPLSFISHLPEAFSYGMFQPWPNQLTKWYYFPLTLENFVFPVLLVAVLYKIRIHKTNLRPAQLIALYAGIAIVIISAFTTPVIGSLIRYRMPGLLLMVLAVSSYLFSLIGKSSNNASN